MEGVEGGEVGGVEGGGVGGAVEEGGGGGGGEGEGAEVVDGEVEEGWGEGGGHGVFCEVWGDGVILLRLHRGVVNRRRNLWREGSRIRRRAFVFPTPSSISPVFLT